jgi:transposase-like protein
VILRKIKSRRRYSEEFKSQAVELTEFGKPAAEVATDLGITSDLIYRWRRERPWLAREDRSRQVEPNTEGA